MLVRRWEQAKSGEGRVVLISGEPGIGKSRLTAAISEQSEASRIRRLRFFCSPHHQDSALYPFIAQLERAAGFAREDAPRQSLTNSALCLHRRPSRRRFRLWRELLSLPAAAFRADSISAHSARGEQLFEALLRQLEGWRGNDRS